MFSLLLQIGWLEMHVFVNKFTCACRCESLTARRISRDDLGDKSWQISLQIKNAYNVACLSSCYLVV